MKIPSEWIEELALECLERRATEGDAAIDRVCEAHPELAADIRCMLDRLDRMGLLVEPEDPELEELTTFGDFRLERRLGSGGMGVVWLAEQVSLGRRVAIKRLRPDSGLGPKGRERFQREIEAISRLDHPGICTVYEAGEVDGTAYLAMRYVEGETLAKRLEQRRTPPDEENGNGRRTSTATPQQLVDDLDTIEKVARALHAAHEAGVVHRDVKPGNLMIDQNGEPVVMDFGLARTEVGEHERLTRSGETLGTPAYMAPEQISGAATVDRRADVYALGATLFECLAGRPPFDAHKREHLYHQILTDPPPDPRTSNRHVSSELRAVLDKALEKDPRRRFATALEFADELGRIRRHEPTVTRAPGVLGRTVRWCRRNRAAATALATVTVALLGSLWALQAMADAQIRLRALALLDAANAARDEDPYLAAKLAREALRLQDEPEIIARLNGFLFDLRPMRIIAESDQRLEGVTLSPDGRHMLIVSGTTKPALYRTDGTPVAVMPIQNLGRRITTAAFSRSGREIAIGDKSGTISVFDVEAPTQVKASVQATAQVEDPVWQLWGSLEFSPDDRRILLGNHSGTVLWNRETGEVLELTGKAEGPIWRAAFVGERIVAGGRLWSGDGREILAQLIGFEEDHRSYVRLIDVTADGHLFLTMSADRVRIWHADGKPAGTVERDRGQKHLTTDIQQVEFSPDGERIVLSFNDGPIWVVDRNGDLQAAWNTETTPIVRFSLDGQRVLAWRWDGPLQVFDLDGRELLAVRGHEYATFWFEFLDAETLVSVSWDGTARIWQLRTVDGVPMRWGHHWPDVAMLDGAMAITDGRGRAHLVDERGNDLTSIDVPDGSAILDAVGDGHRVLITSGRHGLRLWNTKTGAVEKFDPPGQPPWEAHLRADGRFEFSRSMDPVILWDPGQSELEKPLGESPMCVLMQASPDATRTLAGPMAGELKLYDADWSLLDEIPDILVRSAQFTPDGGRVAIGCGDGKVRHWDLARRTVRTSRTGHQGFVNDVAWSPSGNRIASGAADSEVRVWDTATMEPRFVLKGMGQSSIQRVAFVHDDLLVVASVDGTVRWWVLDRDRLFEVMKEAGLEELTPEEEARFADLLNR